MRRLKGGMGCLNASFTLMVELVESKHIRLASMGLMIAFSIGEAFVGIFALFLPEWREFHIFTSVPLFLMIPICLGVAESPRWLNGKEKYTELLMLLTNIAKTNRSMVPPDLEDQLQNAIMNKVDTTLSDVSLAALEAGKESEDVLTQKQNTHVKPSQLILDPTMRLYTIIMFSNWSLVTLGMLFKLVHKEVVHAYYFVIIVH